MSCSCPDYPVCCQHIAAVTYGIGHRLDTTPELLFMLRKVDHQELVSQAVTAGNLDRELMGGAAAPGLADKDLGALFGIELETTSAATPPTTTTITTASKHSGAKNAGKAKSEATRAGARKAATKKSAAKKTAPTDLAQKQSKQNTTAAKKAVRVKSVARVAVTKKKVEGRKRRSR